ncbi:MAG TPA: UDP-N-acetylglucosamine 1-carboxyvinyltransferase [Chloroflexota bacterium]|nr:UDP-N-acetylglucosamine 1-carboxyvinyltransferase [Chloroflexota bacterium]
MDSFVIEGGAALSGEIAVAGNKNAALPMLAACLLTSDAVTLDNVPEIVDVMTMQRALESLGVQIAHEDHGRWRIHSASLCSTSPDPVVCQEMRASFVLAGPLLAREGRAELTVPGGDRIGRRPLDTHIEAFRALGASVDVKHDRYCLTAPDGLVGCDLFLSEMSVMATENILMAATLARGTTTVRNAASEPHVQDLCRLLVSMGAHIDGVGSQTLTIEGVEQLHGASARVGPDYLEVGSFIALAALTRSQLWIRGARPDEHRMTAVAFGKLGLQWQAQGDDVFVPRHEKLMVREGLHGDVPRIHDAPWPGFPADLTSIALVLATQTQGTCLIHQWMYESRLYWVDRLIAMGARVIVCDPHRALVTGPSRLYGQTVSSPDIRAGMALLLAALVAEGRSVIHNAQQIDRGYERIDARLRQLGARIERVTNN